MAKLPKKEDNVSMYSSLFENLIDGFAIHEMLFDKKGNPVDYIFLDVNPAFETITGLKKKDVLNKHVLDILPGTEEIWIKKYGEVVKSGIPIEFDNYSAAIGKYFSVKAYKSGQNQFAVSFRDITVNKEFEKEITESELKYRTLFESMQQGVFYQDAEGFLVDANQAALNMFGISREEFLSRTSKDSEWDVINTHGEKLPWNQHPSIVVLREGKPVLNYELAVFNKKRGEYVWMIVNAIPEFRQNKNKPFRVAVTLQDITERKKAEDLFKESMSMAQALLNASTDAAFLMKPDGTLIAFNEETARRLNAKREDLDRANCYNLLPVHVAKLRKGKVDEVVAAKKTVRFIDTRNGRIIDNTISPIFDKNGNVNLVAAFGKDITESVKSLEAIKESEEKYKRIFDTANEGIWVLDSEYKITSVNNKMAHMLGCTPDEMINKNITDYIFPEDYAEQAEILEKRKKGISETYERKLKRKDGTAIWGIISATPIFDKDKRFAGSFGMVTYITERKIMEETIKRNELLLKMSQKIAKLGGWEWDVTAKTMKWTDETYRIHGIEKEDSQEESERLIQVSIECYEPADREKIMEAFNKCIQDGKEYDLEFLFKSLDGKKKWIKTAAQPVYNDSGKIVKVTGEIQDISDIKKAEISLKEANERMTALLTAIPDMMFILSREGTYLEYFGPTQNLYSDENSFIGKKVEDIMPEEMAQNVYKIINEVLATEKINFYSYSLEINSEHKYFEARFVKCGLEKVLVIVRDVTADKKSEAEINEKNILLNSVLEHTNMMSVYLDCNLNFIWVNKAYADTCGYPSFYFQGKNHFEIYPHEENEKIFRNVVKTGEPFFVNAKPFVFPDQPERGVTYWDWSLMPVKDYSGKVGGLVFTLIDVTSQQKAANELQSAYLRLNALWNVSKISEKELAAIYDNILDASVKMTESEFGFFGIVFEEEDKVTIHKWYGITMDDCKMDVKPVEYSIKESGIWAEAIRSRSCIMLNDFSQNHPAKRGFPKGHVQFRNLLAVPGYREGKIVSVVAVANKSSDYSDSDIKQMEAFLSSAQLIIDRKIAEENLYKSLREKELLLKEIHHRVKNNFQLVSSLLNLQASMKQDESVARLVGDLQNRIKSMSLIHELMYSSGSFAEINASEYLTTLSGYLKGTFAKETGRILLNTEIEDVSIDLDHLIPVGIIINELVSNSFEHAFPDGKPGSITIKCGRETEGMSYFSVEDDGCGLPSGFDIEKLNSVGLFLVNTLARQLKGELLVVSSGKGTTIKLLF